MVWNLCKSLRRGSKLRGVDVILQQFGHSHVYEQIPENFLNLQNDYPFHWHMKYAHEELYQFFNLSWISSNLVQGWDFFCIICGLCGESEIVWCSWRRRREEELCKNGQQQWLRKGQRTHRLVKWKCFIIVVSSMCSYSMLCCSQHITEVLKIF